MGTSISFNEIPADVRAPGVLVEFDSSRAIGGAPIKPYKVLIVGQRLSSGTVAALVPKLVTSVEEARGWFGKGSMLHQMIERYLKNDHESDATVIALDDAGAGVAATLAVTVTATAAGAGTIALYVGFRRVLVRVAAGDTASVIATNMAGAINLVEGMGVTAAAGGAVVTLTARHKGTEGNQIDVRINYYSGEDLPSGVSVSNVPNKLTGGTSNPTIGSTLWAAIGDIQYDVMIIPYTDAANIAEIDRELADRWGPVRANDGIALAANLDTLANLGTFAAANNTKNITILGSKGVPNPPWEIAAAYGAVASFNLRNDPARPLRTLQLAGIGAPAVADRFLWTERDLLFGISKIYVGSGGEVLLDRTISAYRTAPSGAPDTAYLDIMTQATLSYLRWDLRRLFAARYPRHKIAQDGTRFGRGQVVITPKIAKAECLSAFERWEERGLVEDFEGFKRDMIAEVNASDPTRLDLLLPVNLVNPFYVLAAQIQFRL